MGDLTSTSFGLLIAFLLPGLAGLYSLTFFSQTVQRVFGTFLTAQSNVGLFILVLIGALTIGLEVTIVRWLIFECLLCRKHRLCPQDFAKLSAESKLASFRAAVDEHYRYHQFWGGMFIVAPILFVGVIVENWAHFTRTDVATTILCFGVIEMLTGVAAAEAFRNYGERAKSILREGQDAKRLAQEGHD